MKKLDGISDDLKKILLLFLTWRILLFLFLLFAINFVPLAQEDRFLGGGPINYKISPELFSWANFDGEHYLSIAIFGYKGLEQAFFPVYPMIISFISKPFSLDLFSVFVSSTVAGIIISQTSILLALIFLWRLLRLDFSNQISFLTLTLILIFPTSFYFAAVYNEALFLLLTIVTFYLGRTNRWFLASVFGFVASSTRIFGLLLFPALLIEAWQEKLSFRKMLPLFLIPFGLVAYMIYQFFTVGDALAFYNLQKIVGEQHQSGFTLLPQVYFRYIKMLLTVDMTHPIYQTIVLEFIVGILFFFLPIYGYFRKIKVSYLVFALLGFLMPTIQGSFSSVPRYVIVFFPSFLAMAIWLNESHKTMRIFIMGFMVLWLFVETTLFLRGYWVA